MADVDEQLTNASEAFQFLSDNHLSFGRVHLSCPAAGNLDQGAPAQCQANGTWTKDIETVQCNGAKNFLNRSRFFTNGD